MKLSDFSGAPACERLTGKSSQTRAPCNQGASVPRGVTASWSVVRWVSSSGIVQLPKSFEDPLWALAPVATSCERSRVSANAWSPSWKVVSVDSACTSCLSVESTSTRESISLVRPLRSQAVRRSAKTPLISTAGSSVASRCNPWASTAERSAWASVVHAPWSIVPPYDGAISSFHPISCRSFTDASSCDAWVMVTGCDCADVPANDPPHDRAGAATSSGSRTRTVRSWTATKPSASVTVTRTSTSPGAMALSLIRPLASMDTLVQSDEPMAAPRTCTVVETMGAKLLERTVASTVCPGSTGVDGVRSIRTCGAFALASATTRSVKLWVTVFKPSLTCASTTKSPTCPGPGVQLNRPACAS